jgi:lysozyme
MQTDSAGLAFIAENEGLKLTVYDDNGKQAIGYGHDLLPAESFPDGITQPEALALLQSDLQPIDVALASLVAADCTHGQWNALADFAYNLGIGSLKQMLSHGWDQVPAQIPLWNHVNHVVSAGLTARREAEVALFTAVE